jgi:hypothetical protein
MEFGKLQALYPSFSSVLIRLWLVFFFVQM